jgi:c-di-AMP phosphodiesterase-like protein
MGHHNSDLDSIGSAVGLAGAISLGEKQVNVVVDRKSTLANVLIENTIKNPDFADLFLDIPTALLEITSQSLLIIVDVHNRDLLESPDLYERAKTVVVIDHHRKVVNYIDKAVIFHHEPFASSASEMVTEIIQYLENAGTRLPNCCADALLAGITLDTKNFVMRTGTRTFEAAAYLRKAGADTVAVRKFFASSIDTYKHKMEAISNSELYKKKYAISVLGENYHHDDVRIVAPQAADELLNVEGVEASFLIFSSGNDLTSISARSLGSINVQLIMEELGGGGHQNMAAVQLKGVSTQDARAMLMIVLDNRE